MKQKQNYAKKVQNDVSTSDNDIEKIETTVFSVIRRAIKLFKNVFNQTLIITAVFDDIKLKILN